MLIHATAVEFEGCAVLLMGPSGCGKSDLALRLVSDAFSLISDDLVRIEKQNGWINAAVVSEASGRLMVRGVGIFRHRNLERAPLALAVSLVATPQTTVMGRLSTLGPWHGCHLPVIDLYPFECSAVEKTKLAVERFGL
jgi:HPr kinase/phosphorylase